VILVTGASGTVGARLVRGLVEQGRQVKALVLPDDPFRQRLDGIACQVVTGDITRPESLAGLCTEVRCVYHLAAVLLSNDPQVFERVNVQGTRNVLAAAGSAGVGHFIYVSSASVVYPRPTPYSHSKLMAERLVLAQRGMHFTIVRPTLVYERQGGEEFLRFQRYLRAFPVVPFIGPGRAMKRPVYAGDLMDGLLRLAENPKAFDQTYHFSGGEAVSIAELARLILAQHGSRKRFVHLPVAMCETLAMVLSWVSDNPWLTCSAIAGVTQDADLDNAQARRDLDYHPIGIRAGLERCRSGLDTGG
jgi:nucleoside-diphosphate-sugar epimerase